MVDDREFFADEKDLLDSKKLESRKNKFLLAAGNKRSSKDGRREKARSTKSKNFAVLSKRQ